MNVKPIPDQTVPRDLVDEHEHHHLYTGEDFATYIGVEPVIGRPRRADFPDGEAFTLALRGWCFIYQMHNRHVP